MAGKSLTRLERGLRLDLGDLRNAVETTALEVIGQFIDKFIVGEDQAAAMSRAYIVRGFTVSKSGTVITVTNGTAILKYIHEGQVKYGGFLTASPTSQSIDIGAFTDGTYYVYIRFDTIEDTFKNRIAWDPLSSPSPVERVRNVPTRKTETWSLTVSSSSPGDDWYQIASTVLTSGSLSTPVDLRDLFFEGKPSGGVYTTVPTSDWGTTNDKNSDRSTYGVFGLRKFVRAIQQRLEGLKNDGTKWWQDPVKTMADKLNRDGTNTITGTILPDADGTRSLGDAGTKFASIYGTNITGSVALHSDTLTAYTALTNVNVQSTGMDVDEEVSADRLILNGTTPSTLVIGTDENTLFAPMIPKACGSLTVTIGSPPSVTRSDFGIATVTPASEKYKGDVGDHYVLTVTLDIPMDTSAVLFPIITVGHNDDTPGAEDTEHTHYECVVRNDTEFTIYRMKDGVHYGFEQSDPDLNYVYIYYVVFGQH